MLHKYYLVLWMGFNPIGSGEQLSHQFEVVDFFDRYSCERALRTLRADVPSYYVDGTCVAYRTEREFKGHEKD